MFCAQVTCTVLSTGRRRTLPVIVKISDLNDNGPVFLDTPYSLSLAEDTRVGETVFTGLRASDPDHGGNGQLEYSVVPGDRGSNDGYGYFDISLPHQVRSQDLKMMIFSTDKIYNSLNYCVFLAKSPQ